MKRSLMLFLSLGLVAAMAPTTPADAGSRDHAKKYRGAKHKGAKVRGFVARRGGYSYTQADIVNTYGLSRSNYGSVNVYRDPMLDRQTTAGPFDHGFFFDSGIGPRGGNSPYTR